VPENNKRKKPSKNFQLEVSIKMPVATEVEIIKAVNADNCLGVRFCVLSI
jgi:hypothetical protein